MNGTTCKKCGYTNTESFTFCVQCGTKLIEQSPYQTQEQPDNTPPSSKRINHRAVLYAVIFLLIIMLTATIAVMGFRITNTTQPTASDGSSYSQTAASTPEAVPTKEPDKQIIDWKRYVNNRFGFAVHYPSQWDARPSGENGSGAEIYNEGRNSIIAYASFTDTEFENKLLQEYKAKGAAMQSIKTTEGLMGRLVSYKDAGSNIIHFTVVDGNISYNISSSCSDDFMGKYPGIIEDMARRIEVRLPGEDKSSYQPATSTNDSSSKLDISAWQEYIDNNNGFCIKYPAELLTGKIEKVDAGASLVNDGTNFVTVSASTEGTFTHEFLESQFKEEYAAYFIKVSDIKTDIGLSGKLMLAASNKDNILDFHIIRDGRCFSFHCYYDKSFKDANEAVLLRMASTFHVFDPSEQR